MCPVDILIPSFDGFSDMWWITDRLFRKYWPDRTWPMYWISNTISPPEGTIPLMIDPDMGFSGNVLSVIDDLAEAILMWMEECFLLGPIDNEVMLTASRLFYENDDIAAVVLGDYYGHGNSPYKDGFNLIARGVAGRVSTQPIIWRKYVLRHLLEQIPVSSLFEQKSARVLRETFPDMLVITPAERAFWYCEDSLRRGKWRRCALKHFGKEGLSVPIGERGVTEPRHDGSRRY